MSLDSIKAGFLSYLAEKLQKDGKQLSKDDVYLSSISLFMLGDEFKNYLIQEYNADTSIFDMSIDEIMQMDLFSAETQDLSESSSEIVLSNDDILDFLNGVEEDINSENIDNMEIPVDVPDVTEEIIPETEITEPDSEIPSQDEDDIVQLDGEKLSDYQFSPEVRKILDEIYLNSDVLKAIDTDGDGKLSDEEKLKFENYIKENFPDNSKLTEDVINQIVQLIKDGNFSYDKKISDITPLPDAKIPEMPAVEPKDPFVSSPEVVHNPGGGGGDYQPQSTPTQNNTSPDAAAPSYNNMSLTELESERSAKQSELSKAQGELAAVNSGEDSEVKSAQEAYIKAEEDYKNAVENDPAIKEYEKDIKANLEEIDNAQKDVDSSKNVVADCENKITDQKSVITGLKSQLAGAQSALDSFPSTDLTPEQQAAKETAQKEYNRIKAALKAAEQVLKEELEPAKTDADNDLKTAEDRLKDAQDKKIELDKIVETTASEVTKQALTAYNSAKENLETVKSTRTTTVQSNINSLQTTISELDTKINEKKQAEIQREYSDSKVEMDVNIEENLTDSQKNELETIKGIYLEHKDTYEDIAAEILKETGVSLPAEAICAIHYRESSCNFNTYLHNGQPLGQVTTIVPKGIYFDNFRDAAIDAIKGELDSTYTSKCNEYNVKSDCSTMSSVLMFTERYNGFGYRNKGVASAYVYSGTTSYTGGMYVADGKFSSSTKDSRCGTAVIIKELMSL